MPAGSSAPAPGSSQAAPSRALGVSRMLPGDLDEGDHHVPTNPPSAAPRSDRRQRRRCGRRPDRTRAAGRRRSRRGGHALLHALARGDRGALLPGPGQDPPRRDRGQARPASRPAHQGRQRQHLQGARGRGRGDLARRCRRHLLGLQPGGDRRQDLPARCSAHERERGGAIPHHLPGLVRGPRDPHPHEGARRRAGGRAHLPGRGDRPHGAALLQRLGQRPGRAPVPLQRAQRHAAAQP